MQSEILEFCYIFNSNSLRSVMPLHESSFTSATLYNLACDRNLAHQFLWCRKFKNASRVLQKHWQPAIFLYIYSTLQCQLHVTITLVLFRWLAVSINREMAPMLCELLNNADCYLCYVIKMPVTSSSKCANKM